MKKHLLFLSGLLLLGLISFAQSNLVIFSEDGDPFYAYINGVKQNDTPQTNVKVTGISPNVSLRVEFDNKALPVLKQSMPLEPGFEYAVRIVRNNKKELKLRYFGQTPIANAASTGATTMPYRSSDNSGAAYNTSSGNSGISNDAGSQTLNSNGGTVSSSYTTSTTTNNVGGVPSVNINMSGTGVSMNVSGMDNGGMTTTSSTTVTSSSSSSGSSYSDGGISNSGSSLNSDYNANNNAGEHHNHHPRGTNNTNSNTCIMALDQNSFVKMKQSVEAKPFSDTKMSTAKVATKNACLSANQIKEICKLFSMDDDKLAYAEYAYDYCVDKNNFYHVSEVFSFSSTTDTLNKFLESK